MQPILASASKALSACVRSVISVRTPTRFASLATSPFQGEERKERSLLAYRAVEGRAPILHDAFDDAGAARRHAALALAVIDAEMVLEITQIAVRPFVIAQR